jgi:hypothetical protein
MSILVRAFRLVALAALLIGLGGARAAAQPKELPLGSPLPMADASFQQAAGGSVSLGSLMGSNGLVLVFWSNQCLWADKYQDRLLGLAGDFRNQGFNFALVNANDAAAFPQEAASASAQRNLPLPYLVDAGSRLAQALGASRTPHVFVFDASNILAYVGSIDSSPGDPKKADRVDYLREALVDLAGGVNVRRPSTEAFGCMIKFQNPGG